VDVTPAAFTLQAEGVVVDRADFGSTWNQLGMLRGPSTVDVVARFTRPDPLPPIVRNR